jgi:hypothetical protein
MRLEGCIHAGDAAADHENVDDANPVDSGGFRASRHRRSPLVVCHGWAQACDGLLAE